MTLGNDETAWLRVGKTTAFMSKVTLVRSELRSNRIVELWEMIYFFLIKDYIIACPFFQRVLDQ